METDQARAEMRARVTVDNSVGQDTQRTGSVANQTNVFTLLLRRLLPTAHGDKRLSLLYRRRPAGLTASRAEPRQTAV